VERGKEEEVGGAYNLEGVWLGNDSRREGVR